MRVFTLKQLYPGSPAIGTRVVIDECGNSTSNTPFRYLRLEEYLNSPGFWEELEANNYKILYFKHSNGCRAELQCDGYYRVADKEGNFMGTCSLAAMIASVTQSGLWAIEVVERLSDNAVFTVGEKCEVSYATRPITEFVINVQNKPGMWARYQTGACHLDQLKKSKVLFTSTDGVEIFEGDSWWYVAHSNLQAGVRQTNTLSYRGTNVSEVSRFADKAKAEEFLKGLKRQPVFITNDGVEIYEGDNYWCINTANYEHCWENKCKAATHIQSTWRVFATEKAARKFFQENKPCLSLNDIAKVYKTANQYNNFTEKYSSQGEALRRIVDSKLKHS